MARSALTVELSIFRFERSLRLRTDGPLVAGVLTQSLVPDDMTIQMRTTAVRPPQRNVPSSRRIHAYSKDSNNYQ